MSSNTGHMAQDARSSAYAALTRSQAFLQATMPSSHSEHPLYTIAENAKETAAQLQARVAAIRAKYDEEEIRRKYRVHEAFESGPHPAASNLSANPYLTTSKVLAVQSVLSMFGSSENAASSSPPGPQGVGSISYNDNSPTSLLERTSPPGESLFSEPEDVEMDAAVDAEDQGVVYVEVEDDSILGEHDAVMEEVSDVEIGSEDVVEIVELEDYDSIIEGSGIEEDPEQIVETVSEATGPDLTNKVEHVIEEDELIAGDIMEEDSMSIDPALSGGAAEYSSSTGVDQPVYSSTETPAFQTFANDSTAFEPDAAWLADFIGSQVPEHDLLRAESGMYGMQHAFPAPPPEPFAHIPPGTSPDGRLMNTFASPTELGSFDAYVNMSPITDSQLRYPIPGATTSNPLEVLAAAASWNALTNEPETALAAHAAEPSSVSTTVEPSIFQSSTTEASQVLTTELNHGDVATLVGDSEPAPQAVPAGPAFPTPIRDRRSSSTTSTTISTLPHKEASAADIVDDGSCIQQTAVRLSEEVSIQEIPNKGASRGERDEEGRTGDIPTELVPTPTTRMLDGAPSASRTVTSDLSVGHASQEDGSPKEETMEPAIKEATESAKVNEPSWTMAPQQATSELMSANPPQVEHSIPADDLAGKADHSDGSLGISEEHLAWPQHQGEGRPREAAKAVPQSNTPGERFPPATVVIGATATFDHRRTVRVLGEDMRDATPRTRGLDIESTQGLFGDFFAAGEAHSLPSVPERQSGHEATLDEVVQHDGLESRPEPGSVDETMSAFDDSTEITGHQSLGDGAETDAEDAETVEAIILSNSAATGVESTPTEFDQEDVEHISEMLSFVQQDEEDAGVEVTVSSMEHASILPNGTAGTPLLTHDEPDDDDKDDISVVSRMLPIQSREGTPVPSEVARLLESRASTPFSATGSDLFSGDYDVEEFHPELEARDGTTTNPFEGLALPKRQGLYLLRQDAVAAKQSSDVGSSAGPDGAVPEKRTDSAKQNAAALMPLATSKESEGTSELSDHELESTEILSVSGDSPPSPKSQSNIAGVRTEDLQSRSSSGAFGDRIDKGGHASGSLLRAEEGIGASDDEAAQVDDAVTSTLEDPGPSTVAESENEALFEEDSLSDVVEIVPHHHGPPTPTTPSQPAKRRQEKATLVPHRPFTRAQCHWEKIRVEVHGQPSRTFFVTICNIDDTQALEGITREGPGRPGEFDQSVEDVPALVAEGMFDTLQKLQEYIHTSPLGSARWLPVSAAEIRALRGEAAKDESMRKAPKRGRAGEDEPVTESERSRKNLRTPPNSQVSGLPEKSNSEPRRTRSHPSEPASSEKGNARRKSLSFDDPVAPTWEIAEGVHDVGPTSPPSTTLPFSPGAARYPLRNHPKDVHEERERGHSLSTAGPTLLSSKRKQGDAAGDEDPVTSEPQSPTRSKRRRT